MMVSSSAKIGTLGRSLRPMACQIVGHSHVPWIQPQSCFVSMILPYLKMSQNIEG